MPPRIPGRQRLYTQAGSAGPTTGMILPASGHRPGVIGLAQSGASVLAFFGGSPPLPVRCTKHSKDLNWTHDLLWYFLHEVAEHPWLVKGEMPSIPNWFDGWFRRVNSEALTNRHKVYELLVDNPLTAPQTDTVKTTSPIPWNQNHREFKAACSRMRNPIDNKKACGTIVKVFFEKYMVWEKRNERSVVGTGSDLDKICKSVVASLERKKPVRVRLANPNHYIGIVGCNGAGDRFLCIEPWAGNYQPYLVYALRSTGFLATLRYSRAANKIEYEKPHSPDSLQVVGIEV